MGYLASNSFSFIFESSAQSNNTSLAQIFVLSLAGCSVSILYSIPTRAFLVIFLISSFLLATLTNLSLVVSSFEARSFLGASCLGGEQSYLCNRSRLLHFQLTSISDLSDDSKSRSSSTHSFSPDSLSALERSSSVLSAFTKSHNVFNVSFKLLPQLLVFELILALRFQILAFILLNSFCSKSLSECFLIE
jgi:hypothetical protein